LFEDFTVRIHFLLLSSYRINEQKETKPRLSLQFRDGEINLYACCVQVIEGDINMLMLQSFILGGVKIK
jgi:endonuclease-8